MKKIFFLIIFLSLLPKTLLAETSFDYIESKKGELDIEIRCKPVGASDGQSGIYGFQRINNKLFAYNFADEENIWAFPISTVKEFKREVNNTKINIYMSFAPLLPEYNLGDGFVLSVYFNMNEKWENVNYFVKDTNSEMMTEWQSFGNMEPTKHDVKLHEWSVKAFKKISKQLDFGEPFEIVDLDTLNKDNLITDGKGNFYGSQQKCKKL